MRQYFMDGDFFIGASVGTTLAKLALRYVSLCNDVVNQNKFVAQTMLIIAAILHLGKSGNYFFLWYIFLNSPFFKLKLPLFVGLPAKPISNDDVDRLLFILRVLTDQTPEITEIFTKHCRTALSVMLSAKTDEEVVSLKVALTLTFDNTF